MMKEKQGKELEFISQINRDGSGTTDLKEGYAHFMRNDKFRVTILSMTQKTHIASGFNSFVVRIKD